MSKNGRDVDILDEPTCSVKKPFTFQSDLKYIAELGYTQTNYLHTWM